MGSSAQINEYREQEGNSGSAGCSNGDVLRELNRGTEVAARKSKKKHARRRTATQERENKNKKKVPNVLNS